MQASGNLWKDTWENAKPVPCRRQKRLFDDTREAEKVIQYLTTLRPGDVGQMLLPTFVHSALFCILQESFQDIPDVHEMLNESILKISQATRLHSAAEVKHYMPVGKGGGYENEFARRAFLFNDVIKLLCKVEVKMSRAYSLQTKFMKNFGAQTEEADSDDVDAVKKQMRDFVRNLYTPESEVPVLGAGRGPTGQLICKMFADAKRADSMISPDDEDYLISDASGCNSNDIFPRAESREFVLRTCVGRPYPYSQSAPQRMYCLVKDNEFRVAGAFTIDKQFL